MSPRVRSAFTDVRRRMLPAIIQQKYAQAKSAFDRKDFKSAADGFSQVLVALADPAVSAEAARPPLSDLRMLAVGFEELERQGRGAAATAAAVRRPSPRRRAATTARRAIPVYSGDEPERHPAERHQPDAAALPGAVLVPRNGILEVLINETGEIESAADDTVGDVRIRPAGARRHQDVALQAGHANGVPVKYRKIVQINVSGTRDSDRTLA